MLFSDPTYLRLQIENNFPIKEKITISFNGEFTIYPANDDFVWIEKKGSNEKASASMSITAICHMIKKF